MLSYLYLATAALKRFEDQNRPIEDLHLLQWSCIECLHVIQERLDDLLKNIPNRFIALCVRWIIFPLGKPFDAPDDRLGHKVAGVILEASEARDRLTKGIYITRDSNDTIGRIEIALEKVVKSEVIEKKIRAAVHSGILDKADEETLLSNAFDKKIISEDEVQLCRDAIAARKDVVKVDDFPQDYWK